MNIDIRNIEPDVEQIIKNAQHGERWVNTTKDAVIKIIKKHPVLEKDLKAAKNELAATRAVLETVLDAAKVLGIHIPVEKIQTDILENKRNFRKNFYH